MMSLGKVALRDRDVSAARSLLRESLLLFREMGDKAGIAENLEAVAEYLLTLGDARPVVLLTAGAAALRERFDIPHMLQADRDRVDSLSKAGLDMLGEPAFKAAEEEGRSMTLEQAVAVALGLLEDE